MAKRPLWWLTVTEKNSVYPFLTKIQLSGESLAAFPENREGDYIKILLPKNSDTNTCSVDPENPDLGDFYKRSFTVCEVDRRSRTLTLYMTNHQASPGPAASWMHSVRVDDEVLITGPGPVDQIDSTAKRVLLIGDLPSFGAVIANLRRLPESAQGDLIFEAPHPLKMVEEACPSGVDIHWIAYEVGADETDSPLFSKLQELNVSPEGLAVWAACEYASMKLLRDFFRDELQLSRSQYYLSSYFKRGSTDEQHKQTRKDEGYKD